jgi:hypothetical protein
MLWEKFKSIYWESLDRRHVNLHALGVGAPRSHTTRSCASRRVAQTRALAKRQHACIHGIRRNFFPRAKRSTPKSRRSRVKIVSILSRFAKCTRDAPASCMPKSLYRARIAEMAGRSVASREASSKGPAPKEARRALIAGGYARNTQAASVITGQHVSNAPLIPRSCCVQASWYSSLVERIATIGPVSTNTPAFKKYRSHRNVLDSC